MDGSKKTKLMETNTKSRSTKLTFVFSVDQFPLRKTESFLIINGRSVLNRKTMEVVEGIS